MSTARFVAALIASSGGATASGALLTVAASLIAGTASGEVNGTAAGATVTASTSLIAGAANGGSGNATAPGTTVSATASLVPGSATGAVNATASGATVTATAALIAGSASGGGASNNIRLQPGLYLERGGYAASLSSLRWWVLDAAMTQVENSGTGATTNSSGQLTIDITASASYVVGDYVPLIVASYNAATSAPDRTVLSGLMFAQAIAQP